VSIDELPLEERFTAKDPDMSDPTYAGKTLDEWAIVLTDASLSTKQQAAQALGAIGAAGHTRAVDVLVDELNKPSQPPDANVAYTTINLLGDSTQIDSDAAVHVAVVDAIGKCGEIASGAVPRLCELLGRNRPATGSIERMIAVAMGDAAVTNAAGEALASIGKPAFPPVRALLQSPAANVRSAAAKTLGLMGAIAREAVPELERLAFRDPFEGTRTNAQQSLQRLR
jgi:HEAT repeat protein